MSRFSSYAVYLLCSGFDNEDERQSARLTEALRIKIYRSGVRTGPLVCEKLIGRGVPTTQATMARPLSAARCLVAVIALQSFRIADTRRNFAQTLALRAQEALMHGGPDAAWAAADLFERALAASSPSLGPSERSSTLEELSFVYTLLKKPAQALKAREEAARDHISMPVGLPTHVLVQTYAEISSLQRFAGKYNESLKTLGRARSLLERESGDNTQQISSQLSELLYMESETRECAGDPMQALRAYDAALDLAYPRRTSVKRGSSGTELSAMSPKHLIELNYLLKRASSASRVRGSDYRLRQEAVLGELLGRGPWRNPHQLPVDMVPGLRSQPFYNTGDECNGGFQAAAATGGSSCKSTNEGGSSPSLARVARFLEGFTEALRQDLQAVRALGLLLPEDECIHDSRARARTPDEIGSSGSVSGGNGTDGPPPPLWLGDWGWFNPRASWVKERDASGCSVHTPGACALLAAADQELVIDSWPLQSPDASATRMKKDKSKKSSKKKGALLGMEKVKKVRVLRVSFSVLGPGGHLYPHCGPTSARLKLHLGLEVPSRPTAASRAGSTTLREGQGHIEEKPCCYIRVGNTTKSWRQGRVLAFDDSFEHEVWNTCFPENGDQVHVEVGASSGGKVSNQWEGDIGEGLAREGGLRGLGHPMSRAIFQLVIAHPDAL